MNLASFIDELFALITATWPEVTVSNGNLITSLEATREQVVETFQAGTHQPPYVVVHIGDFANEPDFGMANQPMRAPVIVHYLTVRGPNSGDGKMMQQTDLHAKMEALRAAIDGPTLRSTFARIEIGQVSTSEAAPVNSKLAAESKTQIIAGALSYSPGLLVNFV